MKQTENPIKLWGRFLGQAFAALREKYFVTRDTVEECTEDEKLYQDGKAVITKKITKTEYYDSMDEVWAEHPNDATVSGLLAAIIIRKKLQKKQGGSFDYSVVGFQDVAFIQDVSNNQQVIPKNYRK